MSTADKEKLLIVYKDGKPIMKFYVKAKHTLADIENYFLKKFPEDIVRVYNGKVILQPYDFDKITKGKILLTPTVKQRKNILTGIRDVDLMVLSNLSDKELFSFCLADKEAAGLCQDENFWRNRFYKKYEKLLQEAPQLKPEGVKWKTFYLTTVKKLNLYQDISRRWSYMDRISWDLSTNTYKGSNVADGSERLEEFWLLDLGPTAQLWLTLDRYEDIEPVLIEISAATYGEPYLTPRRVLTEVYKFYQQPITAQELRGQQEVENPYAEDWTERQAEAGQVIRADMIGQRYYEGFREFKNVDGELSREILLGT